VAPAPCLSPAEHPQGQAFCLHPHPSGYRSLLNTYFYKEILKSCIEIHPICFKFDSISNHNEWKLQGFRYNLYFFVSKRKGAGGRRPTQKGHGDRGEHSKHIDQYEARVLLCTHVYPRRPAPRPGS